MLAHAVPPDIAAADIQDEARSSLKERAGRQNLDVDLIHFARHDWQFAIVGQKGPFRPRLDGVELALGDSQATIGHDACRIILPSLEMHLGAV